ncbi:MAG: hypothetical protein R3F53_24195 [Gammaproteobacteria bacterium]
MHGDENGYEHRANFAGRDWMVLHRDTEKKSFVTTDAPVLLTTLAPRKKSIWGIGFGNIDALVLFPMTESCGLLMCGTEGALSTGNVQMRIKYAASIWPSLTIANGLSLAVTKRWFAH